MTDRYFLLEGGHPPQEQLLTGRAVFTDAYAVIPKGTMQDIVTSALPHWNKTRLWVLARPLTGFAESFSQYLMEVRPGGGSDRPEEDELAQAALFVVGGSGHIWIGQDEFAIRAGSFIYIPPGTTWRLKNTGDALLRFHWIRKAFQPVDGLGTPDVVVTSEDKVTPLPMPGTDGRWTTTRFMDPEDLRFDMHITVVSFEPGAVIPFAETHVMEHGLYVLEGKAVYRLNQDWVEVEAGDFMWLRAFCPQACYAGGPGRFRYLLYKDVNRHMPLKL